MKTSAMKPMDAARLARLIRGQRWAALGTLAEEAPYVSWVAYSPEQDFSGFVLHLSGLARHTRNLLKQPEVSLAISEPDSGEGDPQLLARLSLGGRVEAIERDSDVYAAAQALYLARFPDAEPLFGFADFSLYRFVPESGQYVEGFASTHRLDSVRLGEVASGAI